MEELELPQAAAALARAPGQCAVECAPAQSAALLRAMRAAGLQPGVVFRAIIPAAPTIVSQQ